MDRQVEARLNFLAENITDHFETIEQDVPEKSYVVGGAVRDKVLGIEPNDYDFVTIGETVASMKTRGFEHIEASSFPVFHDSQNQEWALARTEQSTGTRHDQFEAETDGVTLRDDLERRDLTINAMALHPTSVCSNPDAIHTWHNDDFVFIDPHDGRVDADLGLLRHVGPAFAEDPLRVLRVARYAARFACEPREDQLDTEYAERFDPFDVVNETNELMRTLVPDLNRMSRDRIGAEIVTAMEQARRPSRFFAVLLRCGALSVLWPDLDRAVDIPAGPEQFHAEGSTYDHTMMVLDRMHQICEDAGFEGSDRVRRLLMAVVHDIGKVPIGDEQGGVYSDDPPTRFGGHAERGAEQIDDVCRRLGLGSEYQQVMEDACEKHMSFYDVSLYHSERLIDELEDMIPRGPDTRADQRRLPTNDDGDQINRQGATAWEMLDLLEADHEGRLQLEPASRPETLKEQMQQANDIENGNFDDFEEVRPTFDRTPYEQVFIATYTAIEEVSGHEAMFNGTCEDHRFDYLLDSGSGEIVHTETGESHVLGNVLNECEDCWSPGPWVGEEVANLRHDVIKDHLSGSTVFTHNT